MPPVEMQWNLSTLVKRTLEQADHPLFLSKARLTCKELLCLTKNGRPRVLGYAKSPTVDGIQKLVERGQSHDVREHEKRGDLELKVTTRLRG